MEELLKRYTATQQFEILLFFKELAMRTRKSKKISEKRKLTILQEWEGFDTDVVADAIRLFMKRKTTLAQNEKYVKGIMRNKQKEKEARLYGGENDRSTGNHCRNEKIGRGTENAGEGERLRRFAAPNGTESLDCDF